MYYIFTKETHRLVTVLDADEMEALFASMGVQLLNAFYHIVDAGKLE